MKILNTMWINIPKPGNFGDILTPYILKKYKLPVQWVPLSKSKNANCIFVGSIAKFANDSALVLGSGIMAKNNKLNKNAIWKWVRGPETRKRVIECGGECPEIYGDPALLLPRIYNPNIEKRHKIGILPHYIDYKMIKEHYPNHFVINILNDNIEMVIQQILSCEKIITSSLHGIITAHAYNIPTARFELNPLAGDGVKFDDYCQSVDCDVPISSINKPEFSIPDTINTDNIHSILTNLKL